MIFVVKEFFFSARSYGTAIDSENINQQLSIDGKKKSLVGSLTESHPV